MATRAGFGPRAALRIALGRPASSALSSTPAAFSRPWRLPAQGSDRALRPTTAPPPAMRGFCAPHPSEPHRGSPAGIHAMPGSPRSRGGSSPAAAPEVRTRHAPPRAAERRLGLRWCARPSERRSITRGDTPTVAASPRSRPLLRRAHVRGQACDRLAQDRRSPDYAVETLHSHRSMAYTCQPKTQRYRPPRSVRRPHTPAAGSRQPKAILRHSTSLASGRPNHQEQIWISHPGVIQGARGNIRPGAPASGNRDTPKRDPPDSGPACLSAAVCPDHHRSSTQGEPSCSTRPAQWTQERKGPMVPGWVCSLTQTGDQGVMIHPAGNLVSASKVDLLIVNSQAGAAESPTNALLPILNLPLHVRVSAEHDVVAAGLQDRAHHVLDCARPARDITARGGGRDLSGLQLELTERQGGLRPARRIEPGPLHRGIHRDAGADTIALSSCRSRGPRRPPAAPESHIRRANRSEARETLLGANSLSGVVAHELSGLMGAEEVPDDQDTVATGDPTDEI